MKYRVLVDDNYHYMDESERYEHGEFDTLEEAVVACKRIVDEFLTANYKPGMSAGELEELYKMFGEDPWVAGGGPEVKFSAWTYASERAREICKDA
jgi:hypothetical protein